MTPYEIELATALGACSFLPASSQKRFCKDLAFAAKNEPDAELSLRQRHYLEIMAWRMRRQLPTHLVPTTKPLNLPPQSIPKKRKQRDLQLLLPSPEARGER